MLTTQPLFGSKGAFPHLLANRDDRRVGERTPLPVGTVDHERAAARLRTDNTVADRERNAHRYGIAS